MTTLDLASLVQPQQVAVDPKEAIKAASQGNPIPKAMEPPAVKLAGQTPGRAGVSAQSGQKMLMVGKDVDTPDLLQFAQQVAPTVADPMGRARVAAAVDVYSSNLAQAGSVDPNGSQAAAQLDWAKAIKLADSGSFDPETKRLLKAIRTNPNSLSDGEVSGLLDIVRQIGDATDRFDQLDLEDGSVDHVDMLTDGPVPRFTAKNIAAVKKLMGQVSDRIPELSESDGVAIHLLPDQTTVAVTAPDSPEVRDVLRNLYRAVGNQWAPVKPRTVQSLVDLSADMDELAQVVSETWPAGAFDDLGGHPGLAGDTSITAVFPDGQLPRGLRKLGTVVVPSSAAVLERPSNDGETPDLEDDDRFVALPARTSERVRRIVVQANPDDDPATAAAEIELLGGSDVTVYAPGSAPEGWQKIRESYFQDPAGSLRVVRTANADQDSPNTVSAWARPQELEEMIPQAARVPEPPAVRELARGLYRFGDVMVQAPGLRFAKPKLTEATSEAGPLVGVGMVAVGSMPTLTPVFEGQSEDGFDAYARVDGDKLRIQADPSDLSPAVRMGLVLGQAGVKPADVKLEGTRLKLA